MLLETIKKDLIAALKEKKELEVSTLRMIVAACSNLSIEKRGAGKAEVLTEDDVLGVLGREAKKRLEAATLFEKGGRDDLRQKELAEAEIIKRYLPQELTQEEVEGIVKSVMAKMPGASFGEIMRGVTNETKGRADGSSVAALVKKHLG